MAGKLPHLADAGQDGFAVTDAVDLHSPSAKRILAAVRHPRMPRRVGLEGDRGTFFVDIHGGALAEPASLLKEQIGDDEIQLGRTPSHCRNFLDAVKSREAPFATAEIGHRTATICHLNNIALRLGRPFKWDPIAERTDDDEANGMLAPTMRSPWELTG